MDISKHLSEWLTATSIVVAVITWIITQILDRRAKKAAHTADFLAHLLSDEWLSEASYKMAKFIEKGDPLDLQALDPETEKSVLRLLNYYEYVCVFYYKGVLDGDLIKETRGGTMRRTFHICENVIAAYRKSVKSNTLFEWLEKYARNHPSSSARHSLPSPTPSPSLQPTRPQTTALPLKESKTPLPTHPPKRIRSSKK